MINLPTARIDRELMIRSNDVVGEGISEGMHHLHCQLIEGKEFRIIALML